MFVCTIDSEQPWFMYNKKLWQKSTAVPSCFPWIDLWLLCQNIRIKIIRSKWYHRRQNKWRLQSAGPCKERHLIGDTKLSAKVNKLYKYSYYFNLMIKRNILTVPSSFYIVPFCLFKDIFNIDNSLFDRFSLKRVFLTCIWTITDTKKNLLPLFLWLWLCNSELHANFLLSFGFRQGNM
jgi:hypothetical protein